MSGFGRVFICGRELHEIVEPEESAVWAEATQQMIAEMRAEGCGTTKDFWRGVKQESRVIEIARETLDLCWLCHDPLRDDWREVVVYDSEDAPISTRRFHSKCYIA